VSTDNPVIMFIFLIYSLVLRWGNVSNSNVTMKFAQLHYFLSQNIIPYDPPSQKLGGTCHPLKICPWLASGPCAVASGLFYLSLPPWLKPSVTPQIIAMQNKICKKEDILTFLNVLGDSFISHEKCGLVLQKEDVL